MNHGLGFSAHFVYVDHPRLTEEQNQRRHDRILGSLLRMAARVKASASAVFDGPMFAALAEDRLGKCRHATVLIIPDDSD